MEPLGGNAAMKHPYTVFPWHPGGWIRNSHICAAVLCALASLCVGLLVGLVLGVHLWMPSTWPAHCLPPSRGNVCRMRAPGQSASLILLDALPGDLPAAVAIPAFLTPSDVLWLRASGFPPGAALTLTLSAPDGTTCMLPADAIEPDPISLVGTGAVQAFVTPANCASASGRWKATFADAGLMASASFTVVQP